MAEEGNLRAAVVAQVGEERRIAALLRRAQERARRHRRLRQEAALVEERAQLVGFRVDIGVAEALIDAGQRRADALAGVSDDLPVAEMQAADDERAAAGDLVEPLLGLEPDAALRHDLCRWKDSAKVRPRFSHMSAASFLRSSSGISG